MSDSRNEGRHYIPIASILRVNKLLVKCPTELLGSAIRSLESTSDVNAQTVYRWQPNVHPDTIINLEVFTVQSGRALILSCSLEDDGEFVFDDFFQDLLGDSTTTNWSVSRSRYVDHFENGAYLEVQRTISVE